MQEGDRRYLGGWLRVMQGWRWNLIPLLVCNVVVMGVVVRECVVRSRMEAKGRYVWLRRRGTGTGRGGGK